MRAGFLPCGETMLLSEAIDTVAKVLIVETALIPGTGGEKQVKVPL
jgi:hypothetical protein